MSFYLGYYWSDSGLFLEISYGAKSKGGFFGGGKAEGEEKLADYIEGTLKKYKMENLKDIAFKKDSSGQFKPIIPKSSPSCEPLKIYFKLHGRWNQHVFIGE